MSSPEQLQIVQSKFTSGETVVITTEASLMQGWVRAARLLALVNKGSTYAVVILLTSRSPPQVYSDLTIERVLPIDQDFKCDIGTDGKQQDGLEVYLNISSRKLQLVFEMRPGVATSSLVSEIFRAIEVYQKNKNSTMEYFWIQKLTGSTRNLDSTVDIGSDSADPVRSVTNSARSLVELESPDLVVPRRNIASGKTPVAARESVVRYQMACKEDDYTYTEVFRIFVGTWNVNGQPPNGITIEQWLSCDEVPPDLYAIGFQELDLSKEAFLFNDTPREEEWRKVVTKSLHPKGVYQQVALVRLVGIMLIIFARDIHMPHIDNVSVDTVGTGIMGKLGNKGGVAVSCSIHNTSVCFVNAHLAAHCEEFERRNQDYADICARLSFSKYVPPKNFKDHDQIYWLGDLNYRITEMDAAIAKHHISMENYHPVLLLDQLGQQKRLGKIFQGFHEAEINFKPTYKYDPGTDYWDSSEKGRAPAWCDRVLWKGEPIASINYRSHPELKISDHKPVSAVFDSQIRVIDKVKYRKIHEEVMKKLDKLENEFLPQVMVDTTEVIFDTLKFLEPSSKELIIANTGQVPVQFEFIKKLDDISYCKDWLHIEPYTGFIKPGEKCDIKLEVYVDKKSACKLNSGEDKLYDILVLHLEGGKDIFITVTGTYERSCFGSSMEALVHISVPIREVPVGRLMELENNKNLSSEPYSVPKEVWQLVDRLYRHGIKTAGLFETPGLHSEIIAIRDWLDLGSQDPIPGGVHSVAEALLLLLESTAEPLVPYNLHNVCLSAATNYLQCKQLPEIRRTVFLYTCSFLQELLNHSQDNGLDAKTLATLFGSIFLRDPPRSRDDRLQRSRATQATFDRKKAAFVYHFLINDQSDFIFGR
ncbi:inositol polyphosphate 5-phosphatase OCRL-1 isoform X2 [Orussus abietinus]|uniref:inositol polyphosphate 5-phosphatase OCRL-1 isoform X2 n=1 Tax=Orussus abietinus TaxID=222816 RepID=UPI0006253C00|nr:inositol polyphosphate 5-phosphatase OCRL-1 isoform X2 [Orussus abietinus]